MDIMCSCGRHRSQHILCACVRAESLCQSEFVACFLKGPILSPFQTTGAATKGMAGRASEYLPDQLICQGVKTNAQPTGA
jgi:hypothetical protein